MVKNGEIFQFLDQILHKNFHHFSPFFTIFHHEHLPYYMHSGICITGRPKGDRLYEGTDKRYNIIYSSPTVPLLFIKPLLPPQASCKPCPAGSQCPQAKMTAFLACTAGYYCPTNTSDKALTPCDIGTFR